MHLKCVEMLV